jgi:hypothetical protein
MDNDRRPRWPGVGLYHRSQAAITDTLRVIESRVRELEAEARHLRSLQGELADTTRDYQRGEPGTWHHEFLALNLAVRRECLRILNQLAAEVPPPEPRVVVVKIPVFIKPKPSAN